MRRTKSKGARASTSQGAAAPQLPHCSPDAGPSSSRAAVSAVLRFIIVQAVMVVGEVNDLAPDRARSS